MMKAFVTRNQWVKTGQDFFKEQKKLNDKLW